MKKVSEYLLPILGYKTLLIPKGSMLLREAKRNWNNTGIAGFSQRGRIPIPKAFVRHVILECRDRFIQYDHIGKRQISPSPSFGYPHEL